MKMQIICCLHCRKFMNMKITMRPTLNAMKNFKVGGALQNMCLYTVQSCWSEGSPQCQIFCNTCFGIGSKRWTWWERCVLREENSSARISKNEYNKWFVSNKQSNQVSGARIETNWWIARESHFAKRTFYQNICIQCCHCNGRTFTCGFQWSL